MKKFLLLISLFICCTVYIFYIGINHTKESVDTGDAPLEYEGGLTLGGTVENPKNDTVKIGELQTAYIMYTKGLTDFDSMVETNMELLKDVLNYPFNPMKGYLFSAGYDDNSAVQYYYQSNQEETRTVIIRVEHNEDGNIVRKVYDGDYFKLVAVDEENTNYIYAYDSDNDKYRMVVGTK